MAAGEYVSVSSQTVIEKAYIELEKQELDEMPEYELNLLTEIYVKRGLKKETASIVAKELTEHDSLRAHVRDELGITEINEAEPLHAALASGGAFTLGGVLPLLVVWFSPLSHMEYLLYGFAILSLMILSAVAAKAGGSSISKAVFRITFWGTLAMGITACIGHLFGVNIG